MRHACDGRGLLEGFRAAVVHLESYVDEINELNVYPVPDGDTGSNMLATVKAALAEAEGVVEPTLDRVAHAIGYGALMGARGNSGVITSQIVRGMADGLAGKHRFNGADLAQAMAVGTRTAYSAVVKPVEGTILTVMREASEGAARAAAASDDIALVLGAVVVAAEAALDETPSLLPILREAGVVDAGGAGLARLFEGALLHLVGTMPVPPWRLERARTSALIAHADEGFGYETMFLLEPRPGASLNVAEIRAAIEALGESVVLAGDSRAVRVHVHSERPNEILAYGLEQGTLSRITIENLDAEAHEVLDRRAQEFTGVRPALRRVRPDRDGHRPAVDRDGQLPTADRDGHRPAARKGRAQPVGPAGQDVESVPLAVIAVAAGEGLAAVFRSFGVTRLVEGGQGANPSTGDLVAAVEETAAARIVLLPNNSNSLLAARQAAQLTGQRVTVVPTRNAAEGLAALLAFDPAAPPDQNVETMTRAARSIQTLQVTQAVRDARIGDRAVTTGQVIVLEADDGLVSADTDETRAVIAGIDSLIPGYELLTIYYGVDVALARAEALGRQIEELLPEAHVEVVRGAQPHYLYLIAAE